MIRPLLSKGPTFCNLTSYHFFLFCHVAVCFLPPLSGIVQFLCDVCIFYLICPYINLAISASLAWCDHVLIKCPTESNWKYRGKKERKPHFFFLFSTQFCSHGNLYTLKALLRINSVHQFPFRTEQWLIHALYHVSSNTTSSVTEPCTGTVKCLWSFRAPQSHCGSRWCISSCELVLLCKWCWSKN